MTAAATHYTGPDCTRMERLRLRIDGLPPSTAVNTPATAVTPGASPIVRELPMPNVTRIYNLNQAHATLLHCWNKLSRNSQDSTTYPAVTYKCTLASSDRKFFQQWLERWEQAFTDYLSSSMPSMASDNLTQCRVLKANHLACTILVSEIAPDAADNDSSESELNAVLELAGAVLQARQGTRSPTSASSSSTDNSPVTAGLDVRDPLCVVMSSASRRATRNYASELLSRCCR